MQKAARTGSKRPIREHLALLGCSALILLAPLFYYLKPLYLFAPDIEHIKGKVLQILEGQIFADPLTGFPTFHPPFYHLFLAPFCAFGLSFDFIFAFVTVLYVTLTVYFIYKVIAEISSREVALWTALLLPFLAYFMGCGQLFLVCSFYFSVPFFLAGLWLNLRNQKTGHLAIPYGILWGITFLLSPGYLFLIGLLFLYQLIFRKNYRQTFQALAAFILTLIPFYIQAYVILSQGMYGTKAFSLWRGMPDITFISSMLSNLLLTPPLTFSSLWCWLELLLAALGVLGFIFGSGKRVYIGLILGAFILTLYHYQPQYAIRIKFFLSIFLAASAIEYLLSKPIHRVIKYGLIGIFVMSGVIFHYQVVLKLYQEQEYVYDQYNIMMNPALLSTLKVQTKPNEFVLATADTYRHYIMPNIAVHALAAWRTGEYYQVATSKSDELDNDYNALIRCQNIHCIDSICEKYGIRIAIEHGKPDHSMTIFQLVSGNWSQVYGSPYFRIYQRR